MQFRTFTFAHRDALWYNYRMYQKQTKKSARELRQKGKTYSEICCQLNLKIPKSTLSDWCRGVKLPASYEEKIRKINLKNTHKGRVVALVMNRIKREEFLKSLKERNLHLFDNINKDSLKLLLAMIYICEGSKRKSHVGLMLGNSDVNLLKAYFFLLKTCYPEIITNDIVRCSISYRVDQDLDKLQRFWSRKLGIPRKQFYKSKPDLRTKGKPTIRKDYKGVCSISSRGAKIQLELEMIANMFFEKVIMGP